MELTRSLRRPLAPTLPGHPVPSELHPSLMFMVPTLGLCAPSPSPAGPTAAAVRGTHSPECPNHPQERSPRTSGDGKKQGRGVRPVHTIPAMQASCAQCLSTVLAGQSSSLMFSAGDPGWVMWALSSHLYIHIHTHPLQRRQSQVLGPQILPNPTPGSSHPTTTFQNTQDRHPPTWASLAMHLGR